MKKKDIKKIKSADLGKTLGELRDKLAKLKFSVAGSKSKNVKEEAGLKKNIARILTAINQK